MESGANISGGWTKETGSLKVLFINPNCDYSPWWFDTASFWISWMAWRKSAEGKDSQVFVCDR